MTQPETTSACLVSSGVVVPPMMMTLTFSRGTWYLASTASSSGRAVPWMPMVLPAKSAGVLMPDSFRKKNAKGWRWNALAKALMGTPRLRPETSTPMDATLPTSTEPRAGQRDDGPGAGRLGDHPAPPDHGEAGRAQAKRVDHAARLQQHHVGPAAHGEAVALAMQRAGAGNRHRVEHRAHLGVAGHVSDV